MQNLCNWLGCNCNLCRFVGKSVIQAILSRNIFCHNLRAFMWRKIEAKSTFVENKWQISGLISDSESVAKTWVTDCDSMLWPRCTLSGLDQGWAGAYQRLLFVVWSHSSHDPLSAAWQEPTKRSGKRARAICEFLYLCICVFVYLCICAFVHLCICVLTLIGVCVLS